MSEKETMDDNLLWYKDAIIYELHIKAFRDGNGDGIGDFEGLLEKLDYLLDLGVTAIWLLPFYPSPLKDDGYDIADYYKINPAYGDLKQFKQLLKEAHQRNLKVITELVINHTSDQHPWFQRARKAPKDSNARKFYVWTDDPNRYKDVRIIFQDYEKSNWTWDPVAQQYYWHRFFHHQPDLNYDNPQVQEEIFKFLDHWCKMGVDGFRLDAVPYLFEREGTNGENLPETHAFLKKLRKWVDENYPGTLLLAEANMWPEDSAAYFGTGDECQMNYHFPVMPRMFMALQMEDRNPITDIFEQTPAIPDTCQWAMFLRNHDELTLEMVTDEERDYMYKAYVKDPKARINLGIRHRLAPLLANNRRKIELLNFLLFTFPGTPVLYYGDEIGMGDNFYLGDRDGVRTPMQWTAERNAGFSSSNPHQLYLPLILDPEFQHESVNVELQSHNTSSLLWWMKRIISTRKKYKAFSRGDMKFITAENSKVLVFVRSYEEEIILVVASLSRYSQPVEVNLNEFKGYQPVEIVSKNKFPLIKEGVPYFFTLEPYSCNAFVLEKIHPEINHINDLPIIQLQRWKDIVQPQILEKLETIVLPDYLMKIKWFGGRGKGIENIRVLNYAPMALADNSAFFVLFEVSYRNGLPEMYQIPVAFGKDHFADEVKSNCPQAVLARIKIADDEGVLYDAIYGRELQNAIILSMANNHNILLKNSEIKFNGSKLIKQHVEEVDKIKTKILSGEQNNTSLSYDNKFYLKLYRKVDRAINPEVEINKFLTNRTNFKNIPAFIGTIEWETGKDLMILGLMQEMVENNGNSWDYMLDRLGDFNEMVLQSEKKTVLPELRGSLTEPIIFDDVPAEIKIFLEIPLVERTSLLGQRTAEMHIALASIDHPDFKPEEFSLHYQRSLYSSLQSLVRSTFQNLNKNYKNLPDYIINEAEDLLTMKDGILEFLKGIYRKKINAKKIRIHGNYHLGQTLFTGKDFIILDFESEPGLTYSERRLKRSPMRDVAGMIRSLQYAAYGSLFLDNQIRSEDINTLLPYAEQWYHYMSGFFMDGYLKTIRNTDVITKDKEDNELLLETFLLQRAIYELDYEINNRPDWTTIPLRGVKAILKSNHVETAD